MTLFSTLAALAITVPVGVHSAQADGVTAAPLSRAEVKADYLMAQRAGLVDITHRDVTFDVDFDTERFRMVYATYVRLRQSPEFGRLVACLQRKSPAPCE